MTTKPRGLRLGAGAVIVENGKVLLVKEKTSDPKTGKKAGMWSIPAGTLENDTENILDLLRREVKEETGYTVEPVSLVGIYQAKGGLGIVFRAKVAGSAPEGGSSQKSEEISEIKWFSKEEIEDMAEEEFRPAQKHFLADGFDKTRTYPLALFRSFFPNR